MRIWRFGDLEIWGFGYLGIWGSGSNQMIRWFCWLSSLLFAMLALRASSFAFPSRRMLRIPRMGLSSHTEAEPSTFFSQKSFQAIGMSDNMINVVNYMKISRPSKIQAIAFAPVYAGKHSIIGDQTGSGKTLSYLLPLLQRMTEDMASSKLGKPQMRAPYIVVMTPTTELTAQVAKVARGLANSLKFRTTCFTSLSDQDDEQRRLRLGSELLVATPGRLLELLKRKQLVLDQLQAIVLDEVDSLYLDSSMPLEPIGAACPSSCQFVFCSATLPPVMVQKISKEFPGAVSLAGPGLHRVAADITETLIDCSGHKAQTRGIEVVTNNKLLALDKALQDHAEVERTIIFCNTIAQCRVVENHLKRTSSPRKLYSHHSAIVDHEREANLAEFGRPLLKQPAVLICTDRASRGMDFDRAFVDHVVLFDFPREPGEYIRRVGRTGRAGRAGSVTVLAYGRQVSAAEAVVGASLAGQRIDPTVSTVELEEAKAEEKRKQRRALMRRKERKVLPDGRIDKGRHRDRLLVSSGAGAGEQQVSARRGQLMSADDDPQDGFRGTKVRRLEAGRQGKGKVDLSQGMDDDDDDDDDEDFDWDDYDEDEDDEGDDDDEDTVSRGKGKSKAQGKGKGQTAKEHSSAKPDGMKSKSHSHSSNKSNSNTHIKKEKAEVKKKEVRKEVKEEVKKTEKSAEALLAQGTGAGVAGEAKEEEPKEKERKPLRRVARVPKSRASAGRTAGTGTEPAQGY